VHVLAGQVTNAVNLRSGGRVTVVVKDQFTACRCWITSFSPPPAQFPKAALMPVAGLLIARIGSAKLCKISALLCCATLPVATILPQWPLFVSALFCFGASNGMLDVAMNAQAAAVEQQYRQPIMSSFHALWSTDGLVGAATGGFLAARGLTPSTHITLIALVVGAITLVAFPHLLDTGSSEKALAVNRAGSAHTLSVFTIVSILANSLVPSGSQAAIAWSLRLPNRDSSSSFELALTNPP
jgi:hypothetical protein